MNDLNYDFEGRSLPAWSGLGLAGVIIAAFGPVFFFATIVIGAIFDEQIPEDSVQAVLLGVCLILSLCMQVLPLGLGIAGLFQKERSKVLPVIAIVLSSLFFVLGTIFLTLLFLIAD